MSQSKMIANKISFSKLEKVLIGLFIFSLGLNAYLFKYASNFKSQNQIMRDESEKLKINIEEINKKYTDIAQQLDINERDKAALIQSFNQLGSEHNSLVQNYNEKTSEVNTLQKAVSIPDELLKKYSKYYFLNENYFPSSTLAINPEFTLNGKDINIMTEVKPKLESMLLDAKNANSPLIVNSGYRSFLEQKGLKSAYTQKYGIGANAFSADQGYSEHQLGTTIDISDGKSGLVVSFENTNSFKWLKENAYRYGFILSYPKGNAYYIYEPWHFRYVGVELATYLHNNNINFYDLDQNVIDTYKVKLFD